MSNAINGWILASEKSDEYCFAHVEIEDYDGVGTVLIDADVHPDELGETTYRITIITCPVAAAVHRADALRSKPGSGFAGLAQDVLEVA